MKHIVILVCLVLGLAVAHSAQSQTCPDVNSGTCTGVSWSTDTYTTSIQMSNGNWCTMTITYCYRHCTGSSTIHSEVVLSKVENVSQSCAGGSYINSVQFMDDLRKNMRNHLENTHPHPNYSSIPNCPNQAIYTISFGWANCYRMSASNGYAMWEACDYEETTCYRVYTVCKSLITGSLQYTELFAQGDGSEECAEEPNWLIEAGDYTRPCMRLCDNTIP